MQAALRRFVTSRGLVTLVVTVLVIAVIALLFRDSQRPNPSPTEAAQVSTPVSAEQGTIQALQETIAAQTTPTKDPTVAGLEANSTNLAETIAAIQQQQAAIPTQQAVVQQPPPTQQVVVIQVTATPQIESIPTATPHDVLVPLPTATPQTVIVMATPMNTIPPSPTPQVVVVTATDNFGMTVEDFKVATSTPDTSSGVSSADNASSGGLSPFSPGGPSFGQYATDVTMPVGATGDCGRIWQATNGQNLAWTAVFCNWQITNPGPQMKWTLPTEAVISGSGTISFDLYRDLAASQSEHPDPYQVANAAKSPLGLGWFFRGANGDVCVNGNCKPLSAGKTFQLGFPPGMTGSYAIAITLDNGKVEFWQGEKQNSRDDWPLPI
jgi:hypothetical protein